MSGVFEKFDYEVDGDRKYTKTFPNPWGFYYYPINISPAKALKCLKDYLIEERKKIITKLQEDIKKLELI
jgi:hypothetical protein